MYKVHNLIFPSFAYNQELELNNDDETKLVCEDMGISVEDDERTITMVEDGVSCHKSPYQLFNHFLLRTKLLL